MAAAVCYATAGLADLERVMQCATHSSDPVSVLEKYNCYGCYCGKGGAGEPVDEIDTCCFHHDHCYEDLETNGTCNKKMGEVYIAPYISTCEENKNETDVSKRYIPTFKWSLTKCGKGAFECDSTFAKCLAGIEYKEKKQCPTKRDQKFCGFGNVELPSLEEILAMTAEDVRTI